MDPLPGLIAVISLIASRFGFMEELTAKPFITAARGWGEVRDNKYTWWSRHASLLIGTDRGTSIWAKWI